MCNFDHKNEVYNADWFDLYDSNGPIYAHYKRGDIKTTATVLRYLREFGVAPFKNGIPYTDVNPHGMWFLNKINLDLEDTYIIASRLNTDTGLDEVVGVLDVEKSGEIVLLFN